MPIFLFDPSEMNLDVQWQPSADIYRTPQGWVVKFDLAGVRPEDVNVEVDGCSVRVSGIRKDWITEGTWYRYSMEISYSRFEREVRLPCEVPPSEIETKCQEGMLLVHIVTKGTEHE